MLDTTLESFEALKSYAVHPAHVAVADGKVRPYTKTACAWTTRCKTVNSLSRLSATAPSEREPYSVAVQFTGCNRSLPLRGRWHRAAMTEGVPPRKKPRRARVTEPGGVKKNFNFSAYQRFAVSLYRPS